MAQVSTSCFWTPASDFVMGTSSDNMMHSTAADPAPRPSSKRKGTRSVAMLTAAQLARKRANDREAQRAIRARTKEHIESLERELLELKSQQNQGVTPRERELLKRNQELEQDLEILRAELRKYGGGGGMQTSHGYPPPVYEDSLTSSSAVASTPREFHSPVPEYVTSYTVAPEQCDPWSNVASCSLRSATHTTSTLTANREYRYQHHQHLTPSVPSQVNTIRVSPVSIPIIKAEVEYEEDAEMARNASAQSPLAPSYIHQPQWYPMYGQSQSPAL